jgi:hypothetical protein
MENLLYLKKHAITEDICNEIITYYENKYKNTEKNNDCANMSGRKAVGDPENSGEQRPKEFIYYLLKSDVNFMHIEDAILHILKYNIDDYLKIYGGLIQSNKYKKKIYINNFCIGKIQKNTKSVYNSFITSNCNKIITFIIYLNTIDCENHLGPDIFFDCKNIFPIQGDLILFPCDWTFPYRHLSHPTQDKYILKGEFYIINE